MLETTMDSEILIDFLKSQPAPVPFGAENENIEWSSFWSFLKSGTDLRLIDEEKFNGQSGLSKYLTVLSSGRGEAKVKYSPKFNWPYKNILPKDTYPGSVFCLNQENEQTRLQLTNRNGLLFGFMDNFKHQWKKLSISGNSHLTFHIRKDQNGERFLKKWQDLSPYMLPFTDLIISDRYINDKNVRDHNLLDLLILLDKQTPVSYNLLIITQKGDCNFLDEFEQYLNNKIREHKLKAKLGIVLTRKEHDRCILMNYLKIESGDSFNYFLANGNIITNGTEMKLFPLCFQENFFDVQMKLNAFKDIIDKEKEDVRGNISNRLFEYCND